MTGVLLCLALAASGPKATPGGAQLGIAAQGRRISPASDVTLKGELAVRYQAAICNLLTRPDRYSMQTMRSNVTGEPGALWIGWPGDQFGRWLSVLHVAEANGWTPAAANRAQVAEAVLHLQSEDGNFGDRVPLDQTDARIPSGNAFALRGLMDAYEDTHDRRYLDAARKLGHWFEAIFDTWKGGDAGPLHEYYGHCIDGLVKLYELGGDAWALDLAKRAAQRAGRTAHTHHSLSTCRGILDLYHATGDARFLKPVADYLGWCRETRTVSGGVPESMPFSAQDEGCALADYVIANLMMFTTTGEDRYLEEAENTLVNHLAMNQFHTGGFGHRAIAQDIVGGKEWQGWGGRFGSENPGCCSLWGAWALGQIGEYVVTRSGDAVEVNLYPSADIDIPDVGMRLAIRSDYPRMSQATITIHCDRSTRFALRLRVPKWTAGVAVELNGGNVKHTIDNGRAVIDREWQSGDAVAIRFAGGLRLVPWPDEKSAQVGVFDGPLCLALYDSDADVDAYTGILVDDKGKLVLSPDGMPQAVNANGDTIAKLHPIANDWQSPNVSNPHRLRILFTPTKHLEGEASAEPTVRG
jgi:DUF1680 family protein